MLEAKSQMKISRGEEMGNQVDLRCVCFCALRVVDKGVSMCWG